MNELLLNSLVSDFILKNSRHIADFPGCYQSSCLGTPVQIEYPDFNLVLHYSGPQASPGK